MKTNKIYLKDAMRQVQLAQQFEQTFSVAYRKKDGGYGSKEICRNRSGFTQKAKSDLSSIKRENRRAGKAYLEYKTPSGRWQAFEIFWCLMVEFNSYTIDHRF